MITDPVVLRVTNSADKRHTDFAMRVLLFAQIKDAVGAAELDVKISGEVKLAEIWKALVAIQPKLAGFETSTRVARNGEYADAETLFSDRDEAALIPPVSGG